MSFDAEPVAVRLAGVTHRYSGANSAALDNLSVTVPAGATLAVVGPDGVGKSTLLGLVAGVKRRQSGLLRVLGEDAGSRTARDRLAPRIAYMPQGLGRNLYPTLSVVENIEFFARLFGQSKEDRRHRIAWLLHATGLEPFSGRPAGKLSGGMRQKLSLCCTLVHDPALLILDEPTTGVDPLSRRQFWRLVGEIRTSRPGMTLIVATAYMEEAQRFERIVAMDAGRVLAAGTTKEVLEKAAANTLEEAYRALQGGPRQRKITSLQRPVEVTREIVSPPAILARGLTRRFGSFTAVDHVDLRIERGEIFGFLGSNGCGKTTTMKMLTGLLPADEGEAALLGQPVAANAIETRARVGYVSQSFSLYEELSVRANLDLHARLYGVPANQTASRCSEALERFDLTSVADSPPASLALGVRQRLQLAAACLHHPEVLILDEPTSGVDPAARDMFWSVLGELSRREGVTIFISTHFMNEAERCDRISLMHAGKILAVGTPEEIRVRRNAASLEDAFVAFLEEARIDLPPTAPAAAAQPLFSVERLPVDQTRLGNSIGRLWSFAHREMMEVLRDPVRLAFALLGPVLLLVTLGYGVTFDVEKLPFAVFDRDRTEASRRFTESFSGSRYFVERTPLGTETEIDARLRSGELRLAIDIPPGFGRDLLSGDRPEVAFFLDGAMPFRAETTRGYIDGIIADYARDQAVRSVVKPLPRTPIRLEPRFRYNQEFSSPAAVAPGCIMILLLLIPAMLTALGVVREREIGSIINLYASPATVGEFLLGKQAPYMALGLVSGLFLLLSAGFLFDVTLKGSGAALALGAALYVFAGTAFGLLVSTFVRTQVAAIIATAVLVTVPAINFSGYLYPASTLEGAGWFVGRLFPALWFQNISLGTLSKGREFAAFTFEYLALFALGTIFLSAARLLLRKQAA